VPAVVIICGFSRLVVVVVPRTSPWSRKEKNMDMFSLLEAERACVGVGKGLQDIEGSFVGVEGARLW